MSAALLSLADAYALYLDAIRAGVRRRAFEVVEEARAAGHDLPSIYLEVFQPALREIGRLWQQNLLTVAHEHLATAITEWAMLKVYEEATPRPPAGRTLIAACTETERHQIGLRMLCDFMDLEGWQTVFLGAAVPPEALVQLVAEHEPDVLALSASTAPHLPQLRATIAAVRAGVPRPPLFLVGGRPFLDDPGLGDTVGADLVARDAGAAARLLTERFG